MSNGELVTGRSRDKIEMEAVRAGFKLLVPNFDAYGTEAVYK